MRPSSQPCSSPTGNRSSAPAATACACSATGSSTTSSSRALAPPSRAGLVSALASPSSTIQKRAADGELGDDGRLLVRAAQLELDRRAEPVPVEGQCPRAVAGRDGELRRDPAHSPWAPALRSSANVV
jgi:hypothetical protein